MMQASHNQGSICVFACRWCSLLGAERAGRDRLELPANIRLIPVSCAGSVSADHVIQALTGGAAGVAVLGCHLGGCRRRFGASVRDEIRDRKVNFMPDG